MSGGEMITTPFWQLNAVLQGMRYPILIGDASLPNLPSQDPSENNAVCAAAAINGDIVQPGQEFSFYKSIGVPSADRGYQMSRSLVGAITTNTPTPTDTTTTPATTPAGTITTTPVWADDIAGGICKTATVLNLAVENAGLDVTERHHHTMPVPYVPAGQDTAVARSAGWDYCFVNNGSLPVKIESTGSGNTLRFQIWEIWQS
jgi:vancomycin resistance protein YoaR